MAYRVNEISEKESLLIAGMRSFAMLMIVLCHLVNWFPAIQFMGQVLNVGVPLFFMISGFIYGQKQIANVKQWLLKRWLRISLPLYSYYIIAGMALLAIGKLGSVQVSPAVKTLLHVQGLFGGQLVI